MWLKRESSGRIKADRLAPDTFLGAVTGCVDVAALAINNSPYDHEVAQVIAFDAGIPIETRNRRGGQSYDRILTARPISRAKVLAGL